MPFSKSDRIHYYRIWKWFSSLQIFEQEDHASVHSDKSKEGLSLYGELFHTFQPGQLKAFGGILNHTKTLLGRNLLRQWLLRPSLSIQTITARHDAVECFLHPENISTADDLHQHLAKIKNVPRILNTMKSGKAKIKDWQGLFVVCRLYKLHSTSAHELVRSSLSMQLWSGIASVNWINQAVLRSLRRYVILLVLDAGYWINYSSWTYSTLLCVVTLVPLSTKL